MQPEVNRWICINCRICFSDEKCRKMTIEYMQTRQKHPSIVCNVLYCTVFSRTPVRTRKKGKIRSEIKQQQMEWRIVLCVTHICISLLIVWQMDYVFVTVCEFTYAYWHRKWSNRRITTPKHWIATAHWIWIRMWFEIRMCATFHLLTHSFVIHLNIVFSSSVYITAIHTFAWCYYALFACVGHHLSSIFCGQAVCVCALCCKTEIVLFKKNAEKKL